MPYCFKLPLLSFLSFHSASPLFPLFPLCLSISFLSFLSISFLSFLSISFLSFLSSLFSLSSGLHLFIREHSYLGSGEVVMWCWGGWGGWVACEWLCMI